MKTLQRVLNITSVMWQQTQDRRFCSVRSHGFISCRRQHTTRANTNMYCTLFTQVNSILLLIHSITTQTVHMHIYEH